jgi:hypothetical protein
MTNRNNQPTAVILTIDEGDGLMAEMELVYPTRFQAEWFLYQLPYLMTVGQWDQVRAAILSPLLPA